MRVGVVAAVVAAVALAGCGWQESSAPATSAAPPTSTAPATPLVLEVDTSPYSQEELRRAEQIVDEYIDALESKDFATSCQLSANVSTEPVTIINNDESLQGCVGMWEFLGQAIDFGVDLYGATEFVATDMGGGFASVSVDGVPGKGQVVKLNNGQIYIDARDGG